MRPKSRVTTASQDLLVAFRISFITGLILGAALMLAWPAHAESGLDGQTTNARLVSRISAAFGGYARHVDALAQDLPAGHRAEMDALASSDEHRLVSAVAALAFSTPSAETEHFVELRQVVDTCREMHERVAAAARAGDFAAAAHEAQVAAAIVKAVRITLQRGETPESADAGAPLKVAKAN